jgi:hypothetical protein
MEERILAMRLDYSGAAWRRGWVLAPEPRLRASLIYWYNDCLSSGMNWLTLYRRPWLLRQADLASRPP